MAQSISRLSCESILISFHPIISGARKTTGRSPPARAARRATATRWARRRRRATCTTGSARARTASGGGSATSARRTTGATPGSSATRATATRRARSPSSATGRRESASAWKVRFPARISNTMSVPAIFCRKSLEKYAFNLSYLGRWLG